MPSLNSKNKLILFIIINLLISLALTAVIWKFDFPRIDAFFYDFHVTVFKRTSPSANIKLINLTPTEKNSKSSLYFHNFSLKTHKAIIESAVSSGAKIVAYAYDPLYLLTNEKDYPIADFVEFTKKYKNVFFHIPNTFPLFQSLVYKHPTLSKLRITSPGIGTETVSGAMDGVVRRILVDYNPNESIQTLVIGSPKYEGTFFQNGREAVKARFSKKDSYESINVNNADDVALISPTFFKDSIVIVSLNAKDDLFDYRKIPYDHSVFAMMVNEAIANGFDTLIQKDNPKVPPVTYNYIWTFFNLFFFICIASRLPAKNLFLFSFGQLFFIILLPLLIFGITSWQLDTTHPLLMLFLLQYLTIPFAFLRLARQNDKNFFLAKEEKEKAINKVKINAKSAKADLGFRIATQLAHDIKSPIMALETVKMVSRTEMNPDAQKLLDKTITRINNIADSLLKKFKSGAFETVHEPISVDIISTLNELVNTYKQTHSNIHIHLKHDCQNILIPVDQTEIERALTNILNNSIEAMSFIGKINIEVVDEPDSVQIFIEDTGKGIPSEIQKNIFDLGFTYDKKSGTGIGLSQAKEALLKTGGDITLVTSTPGKTIFKIILLKSNLRTLEINTAKNIILIEDVFETRSLWEKIFKDNQLNFISFESFKNFKYEMDKGSFNLFNEQPYTIITDMIFENEDETGFDVIQMTTDKGAKYLFNAFLCTTLSSNEDILKIAKDLNAQVFGKKDLDKIQIKSI